MNILTKYRTELMGLAILWIVFFHSSIHIPDVLYVIKLVKGSGYAGVDIFFLLSGLGIAYSLSKSTTKKEFFIKRFARIIPSFWFILSLYFITRMIQHEVTFNDIWLSFLGLDFILFGEIKFWFIPAIYICYLIAPIFYSSLEANNTKTTLFYSVPAIVLLLVLTTILVPHMLILVIRIPAFLLGIYIGFNSLCNREVAFLNSIRVNAIILLVSCVALLAMINYTSPESRWLTGFWWYPTVLMAYPLCFFVSLLFDKHIKLFSKITGFLRMLGALSLELYLVHNVIIFSTNDINIDMPTTPMHVLYILLSFALAYLINKSIAKINRLGFITNKSS